MSSTDPTGGTLRLLVRVSSFAELRQAVRWNLGEAAGEALASCIEIVYEVVTRIRRQIFLKSHRCRENVTFYTEGIRPILFYFDPLLVIIA
jgi:hypothetical protein